MSDIIIAGNMNFESISEFKQSLNWGAEIEFRWKGKTYNDSIWHRQQNHDLRGE